MMVQEELKQRFLEVCDKVPYERMGKNGKDGQTLYGDVMDWCRDYFGSPKNSELAYMLIGYWFTKLEVQERERRRNKKIRAINKH